MPRSRRTRVWLMVGAALAMASLLLAGACAKDEAEQAFEDVMRSERDRPLEEIRTDLEEIAERWPKSHAAQKARLEIESIDEQLQAEARGKLLLAWDAVKTVAGAAEKYKLRYGRYPGSFADLTPHFLEGPVLDPWGQEIAYVQKPHGYHVICYGEDGLPGGGGLSKDLLIDTGQVVGGPPLP